MRRGSSRTVLLLAVVVVLVLANVWWFGFRPQPPAVAAFEFGNAQSIGLDGVVVPTGANELAYDPLRDEWNVAGRKVSELRAYLRRLPANPGGPFLVAKLSPNATGEDVRRTLLSLVGEGVCLVALDAGEGRSVPIRRIVSVRDNDGRAVACDAAQSPAAASSASK